MKCTLIIMKQEKQVSKPIMPLEDFLTVKDSSDLDLQLKEKKDLCNNSEKKHELDQKNNDSVDSSSYGCIDQNLIPISENDKNKVKFLESKLLFIENVEPGTISISSNNFFQGGYESNVSKKRKEITERSVIDETKRNFLPEYDDDVLFPKCKICFIHENPFNGKNDLITPCGCKGSMKYVHKTCLKLWRFKGKKQLIEIKRCEQCYCDYKVDTDLNPCRSLVAGTNIVLIFGALLIGNFLINSVIEAISFIIEDSSILEMEYNEMNTERIKHRKQHKVFDMIPKSIDKQSISEKKETMKNSDDNDLKKPDVEYFRSDYNFPKTKSSRNRHDYYMKYANDRKPVKTSLFASTVIIIVFYSFYRIEKYWAFCLLLFTAWRYYQFEFACDRYLLMTYISYYVVVFYRELFRYIESTYIYWLNFF